MLPLVLDLGRLKLILIGDGAAAARRLGLLDAAGAVDLTVYAEAPSAALARAAGSRLVQRLPTAPEMATARLVFISDRTAGYCRELAALARALGALVHVEDEPALCDVQAPAVLRRGDLTIAVSTGGKSPGLAVQVKRFLGTLFGPEWQGRLDALAAQRRGWRARGADAETIARWSESWVGRQGWLPADETTSAEAAPGGTADARLATRH
ncbi:MAG: bifunctional precorrin-2 dehydrogenase/sirohydrochlorin ferrochelatase [Stellaceae bacterium]